MFKCKVLASPGHSYICLFLIKDIFLSQNTSLTNHADIQHINKFINSFMMTILY